MTENADHQSRNQTKDRELAEAQQQLREKVSFDQFRHWKSTVLSDLQEEQMAIHSRLLREKVSLINSCVGNPLFSLTCRRNRWPMMLRSIPDCNSN